MLPAKPVKGFSLRYEKYLLRYISGTLRPELFLTKLFCEFSQLVRGFRVRRFPRQGYVGEHNALCLHVERSFVLRRIGICIEIRSITIAVPFLAFVCREKNAI